MNLTTDDLKVIIADLVIEKYALMQKIKELTPKPEVEPSKSPS